MRAECLNHMAKACAVGMMLFGLTAGAIARQPGSAVAALQAQLLSGGSTCVVKVNGIHAFTAGPMRPMDNRIVNGQVQARRFADALHAPNDSVIAVGTVVRILKVEGMQTAVGDILRILAIAGNGGQVPVAFFLPKGALAGMSEEQLETLVTAVLRPTESMAVPLQRAAQGNAGTAAAPSQTPAWKIRPTAHDNQKGMEALLFGTAETGGRKQAALLTLSCTKGTSPQAYPHALASADVRVRPEMVNFDTGYMEEKSAFHDDAGRSQLGQSGEIHIDIAASTTDKGVRAFGLSYEEPDLKEVVASQGLALRVTIMPEHPGDGNPLTAQFQLPINGAEVQSMMSSCFDVMESEERDIQAKDVVSCPVVEGKVLKDMKVLVGQAGKELENDSDSDQIRAWALPKATKTHPRPKLVMACFYGEPGYRKDRKETLEKRTLPIPVNAVSCAISDASTENRNHGECSRP